VDAQRRELHIHTRACRRWAEVKGRSTRSARRAIAVFVVATIALVIAASSAAAHPLGNFTTNRYAKVVLGASTLRIHYVLDEAELVAFQERPFVGGRSAFATSRAAEIASGLTLTVDGAQLRLVVANHRLSEPPGQGGLATLRLEILYEARLPADTVGVVSVEIQDDNQPDRLGWREIVADTAPGSRLVRSDVPTKDQTNALRSYPTGPSAPRLDVRRAVFSYEPGGADGASGVFGDVVGGAVPASDRFVGIVTRTTSAPLAIAAALLAAMGFGALHAVGPGHGKTIMAAYLVSTRGRRRDAFYLGAIVSSMHTASVLALGLLLATVGRNLDASRIYPGLTVIAGVVVLAIGLRLLLLRWRAASAAGVRDHSLAIVEHHHRHGEASHEHHHDQGTSGRHAHAPGGHTHDLPAGVAPLSRAGLLALGTSGGLFPSPSAVVVLLGAFALGRAPLGLALIGALSLGLALVLVGVGLLLVVGRDRIGGLTGLTNLRWLPVAGAAAVTALGAVLFVQGVTALI
jgi:nickel/cobalt transporter (NicO) family protein